MTTEAMNWGHSPLHAAMVACLPTFVLEPFSAAPRLNIPELKKALGKSHETVYKWLRTSRLTPRNAQMIVDLANSAENVAVLVKLNRTTPRVEDFYRFVFA